MTAISTGHSHSSSHSHHEKIVWMGLMATLALLGFFLFERVVILFSEWKEGKKIMKDSDKLQESEKRIVTKKYMNYSAKDLDIENFQEAARCTESSSCGPDMSSLATSDANSNMVSRESQEGNHQAALHGYSKHENPFHHGHGHSHLGSLSGSMSSVA